MSPADPPPPPPPPGVLWLWGFWILAAVATAAFILSLYIPFPLDRAFRVASGALFVLGGLHNSRVVTYKRAARPTYSTFGPDALSIQRQTGWSAVVLGAVLVASAIVGL